MLEWTGERFLPWRNDPALAYEHLHRYFYAAQFTTGKAVLDLASGEGYGANLLAQSAARVVGVDIAKETVEHARSRYRHPNLEFLEGSITKVPIANSKVFDVVVCFEAIEHIDDHSALLDEIVRLLKPDGLLIVSTPNKIVYDQTIQEENAFHVKELEFDEFRALLQGRFKHVRFLGQRTYAQSNLWPVPPLKSVQSKDFTVEWGQSEFSEIPTEQRQPIYYVAVASNGSDVEIQSSVLVDNGNSLLNEKDRELRETKASAAEALQWREQQIQERDTTIAWYKDEVESLKAESANQKAWYQSEIQHRDSTITSHEEALVWRAGQVDLLEREKSQLLATLEATSSQLSRTTEQLELIHASSGWKFILRMRHYRDVLFPPGSLRRRLFQKLVK